MFTLSQIISVGFWVDNLIGETFNFKYEISNDIGFNAKIIFNICRDKAMDV